MPAEARSGSRGRACALRGGRRRDIRVLVVGGYVWLYAAARGAVVRHQARSSSWLIVLGAQIVALSVLYD